MLRPTADIFVCPDEIASHSFLMNIKQYFTEKKKNQRMKKPRCEQDKSENHKKNLEWDFLHLRISIHRTINKATKLGTKEESKKKNVLKIVRAFFGIGESLWWREPKYPLRKRDLLSRGRKLDGVWGVESPTRLFSPLPEPIPCESLRKYCEAQKTKVSRHQTREANSIIINFLLFVVFPSHSRLSFPIDLKTCRHSSDFYSLALFSRRRWMMEVKRPWHSSLDLERFMPKPLRNGASAECLE